MATTINRLKDWFLVGQEKEASHMIIVCNTFDWEDFPVYVMKNQNARDIYRKYSVDTERKVMEVYNINKDIESQLSKHRAMEF